MVSSANVRPGVAFQNVSKCTTFRVGSIKNIILITDEDDDEVNAPGNVNFAPSTYLAADTLLTAGDALFNFIGRPNFGNSEHSYHKLALDHGGAIFSITAFRADADAFFDNFTETKVKEIIAAAPEPASLALLGLGVMAVASRRRRRKA